MYQCMYAADLRTMDIYISLPQGQWSDLQAAAVRPRMRALISEMIIEVIHKLEFCKV